MASRLLKDLRIAYCYSNKFHRFLQSCWVLRKQCNYSTESKNVHKLYNQQNTHFKGDNRKYGMLVLFAAASVFIYSCKERLKFLNNLIPTLYAVEKKESLRQKYNFIADVVEKSASAVVSIESRILLRGGIQNVIPGGSGFIIQEDGLILTNAHVVINRQNSIVQVKLRDGRIFTGQIEDVDLASDLATVRIKADKLPVIKLGSSTDLRAGEWVIAIGSPLSLTDSVSAGVVSSPQRKGEDLGMNFKDMSYIQTDAAITFGNSGGPLVNLDGEAVGVNSVKITAGISFAVPIEYAKEFLERNKKERKAEGDPNVEPSGGKRGYIGVSMLTLTPELIHELNHKNYEIPEFLMYGILICQVIIGSPAFNSGLQPGDVITEINGQPVNGVQSVYAALKAGIILNIKIFRKGTALDVVIAPEQVGTSVGLALLGKARTVGSVPAWKYFV